MHSLLYENRWAFEEAVRLGSLEGDERTFVRALEDALWAGDVDRLGELAGCRCCCWEHTFGWCPARIWGGCRGQDSMTAADHEAWAAHYERFHGMTREQFFGYDAIVP
jgi:hypothetical protein